MLRWQWYNEPAFETREVQRVQGLQGGMELGGFEDQEESQCGEAVAEKRRG